MKNELLKINSKNNKLNSKVGRILTYKQLSQLVSKLPTKTKTLV